MIFSLFIFSDDFNAWIMSRGFDQGKGWKSLIPALTHSRVHYFGDRAREHLLDLGSLSLE